MHKSVESSAAPPAESSVGPPRAWFGRGLLGLAVVVAASRAGGLTASTSVALDSVQWIRAVAPGPALLGLEGPAGLVALKVVGVMLGSFAVVAFGWLARSVFRDDLVALASAAVFGFLPVVWWWSTELMPEPIALSLIVIAAGLTAKLVDDVRSRAGRFAVAVLALSSASLAIVVVAQSWEYVPAVLLLLAFRAGWPRPVVIGVVGLLLVFFLSSVHVALNPICTAFFDDPRAQAEEALAGSTALLRAFTPAGLALAALGFVLGIRVAWLAALVAIAWAAPTIIDVLESGWFAFNLRSVLRASPAIALGIGGLFRILRQYAPAPIAVGLAASLMVGAFVVHAIPDLRLLWSRGQPWDRVAAYYGSEVADDGLVLIGQEYGVLRLFAFRGEAIVCSITASEPQRWKGERVAWGPTVLQSVQRAFDDGRPVYASSLVGPDELAILDTHCILEPIHEIDRSALRAPWDRRLAYFEDPSRQPQDVMIWRVTPSPYPMMRVLSPPVVATSVAGPRRIDVTIHEPRAAGERVVVVLAQHPSSLDWTRETFGRDNLLQRTMVTGVRRGFVLDADGRGSQQVEIPEDHGGDLFVGYGIQGPDGKMVAVSLPTEL